MNDELKKFSNSLITLDSKKLSSVKSILYSMIDNLPLLENNGFDIIELKKSMLIEIMLIDQKLLDLSKG